MKTKETKSRKELRFSLEKAAFTGADFVKVAKRGAATIEFEGEEAVIMTAEAFSGLERAITSKDFKEMLSDAIKDVESKAPKK